MMKKFLIFFLFFVFSDAAPLRYTLEMKQNLFLDTAITFAKSLNPDQMEIFLRIYDEYRGESEFLKHEGAVKILIELKKNYPDIYKIIRPLMDKTIENAESMSDETKEFFDYYTELEGNLKPGTDSEITKFLLDVLPRWYALSEDTREEFEEKYPKIAKTLNDEHVHEIAGFEE